MEKLYPHQLSFYDDLDIDEAAKGESFRGNSNALFMRNTHHKIYERLFNYLFNCIKTCSLSIFLHIVLYIVSNQIVGEDVHNLRAGLEDVKVEKEKEPDNFILFISSNHYSYLY